MSATSSPSGIRVLVVDDERALRGIRRVLEARGHEVVTATNLAEAMKEAERQQIDVAVVDWHLEHETGGDVCKALSEILPSPIVIVITGDDGEHVQKRSYRAGACAHLPKPLDFEELDLLIRTLHRARNGGSIPPPGRSPFEIDDDLDQVSVDGVVLPLTPTQRKLIRLLCRNLDCIVCFEEVRAHLNGASKHALEQMLSDLRRRLGKRKNLIKTRSNGLLVCSKSHKSDEQHDED